MFWVRTAFSCCGVVIQPTLSCFPAFCLFEPQMTVGVRTATHHVSPAREKRGTSVQNVQKVSLSHTCKQGVFVVARRALPAALMFTLSSPSRALSDHTANMCIKVSGGFLRQSVECCVWGLRPGLFTMCGRRALHPLSECSQSSAVPAGRAVCWRMCQVWG